MPFDWPHPEFRFRSLRNWEQRPTNDERRFEFFCPQTETTVKLSVDPYQVPTEKFERIANGVLELRKKSHRQALERAAKPGEKIELVYDFESVRPHSTGAGYEVCFEGMQPGKSFFGYLGFVSTRKILNMMVDTRYSFAPGCRGMFREIAGSFAIALP
jgi:hypothetical protein